LNYCAGAGAGASLAQSGQLGHSAAGAAASAGAASAGQPLHSGVFSHFSQAAGSQHALDFLLLLPAQLIIATAATNTTSERIFFIVLKI
jgi:hypothetical protein